MIIVYIEDLSVMRRLQTVLDILSCTESSYIAVQRFFRLRVSPLIKLDITKPNYMVLSLFKESFI